MKKERTDIRKEAWHDGRNGGRKESRISREEGRMEGQRDI
jgi:hypothetical protein